MALGIICDFVFACTIDFSSGSCEGLRSIKDFLASAIGHFHVAGIGHFHIALTPLTGPSHENFFDKALINIL